MQCYSAECQKVSELQRLMEIMAHLRSPDGCPWDQEQTHQSLTRCLVEEVSETLEAIDEEDMELLEEELGDLLLQVVFHAQIAKENGNFNMDDVARGISDKLIRRHPHVFGDEKGTIDQADQVVDRWEQVKAEEKQQKGENVENDSIFKKLPPRLPSLLFAYDIYKRAEKANRSEEIAVDWNKVEAESESLNEENAGRALFELVASCRKAGLDPESCLRSFASNQMKMLEKKSG